MIIKSDSCPAFEWRGLSIRDLTARLKVQSSIARVIVPPGGGHPHAWSRRSEKYYLLLSGQLHFFCDEGVRLLEAGDVCLLPQGETFAYANKTNRPVEFILVHTPPFDPEDEVLEQPLLTHPFIYHLTRAGEWQAAAQTAFYTPSAFESDRFIHLCERDEILKVAERYFHAQPGLVLLQVNPLKVSAPIQYEDLLGGGVSYPHIYGALETAAVEHVFDFNPNPDGSFTLPEDLSAAIPI